MKSFLLLCLLHLSLICAYTQNTKSNPITCSEIACQGIYNGPEFVDGSDVAHQFSNEMSWEVGDQLKKLYAEGKYSKVDFENIEMLTIGMGSGTVIYQLYIPFTRVKDKCEAFTSFDHVGGWNHPPALSSRKKQLEKILLPGNSLDISGLKTTMEGLEEYWIQWRNNATQAECSK